MMESDCRVLIAKVLKLIVINFASNLGLEMIIIMWHRENNDEKQFFWYYLKDKGVN